MLVAPVATVPGNIVWPWSFTIVVSTAARFYMIVRSISQNWIDASQLLSTSFLAIIADNKISGTEQLPKVT